MVTKEQIVSAVCDVMGVSREELLSRKKTRTFVAARHMGMFLARDLLRLHLAQVGNIFGRCDTVVAYGLDRADWYLEHDRHFRDAHQEILARLAEMNKRQVAA